MDLTENVTNLTGLKYFKIVPNGKTLFWRCLILLCQLPWESDIPALNASFIHNQYYHPCLTLSMMRSKYLA
jgi:hypothetical protein